MRLTNPTLLRGYNRDLTRLRTLKNETEKKITSTRKFNRASEAPLSAAKALNVRKSQYYDAQYKENLKVAAKFYTEAETSLLQVSSKLAEIRETIIAGCNTTKDGMDMKIYAQQLETNAKELCAIFNTDSAGRSIFGCESDDAMPFEIINDSNGHAATVLYHGVPVNSMNNYDGFPYSDKVYIDIGLGMVTDQKAHTQDPMSMLDISFHGMEITGCGAERSVADIDLTSIIPKRTYVFDIYTDGVKKTIDFIAQDDGNDGLDVDKTIALINSKLDEAYEKEARHGLNHPTMDKQGVIYSVDKDGNAVDNGVVTVVNNTVSPKAKRAEQLVVDNDSGYTSKFRLNFEALSEGSVYKVDVKVGDETKTIEFVSGTDDLSDPDNPIYREDITVKNFQEALDGAFGEGVVNISDHVPTKGIVSSEGNAVELVGARMEDEDRVESARKYSTAPIKTSTETKLNLEAMRIRTSTGDKEYSFSVDGKTYNVPIKLIKNTDADNKVTYSEPTDEEILNKVNEILGADGLTVAADGTITKGGVKKAVTASDKNPSIVSLSTKYQIDTDKLEDGKTYSVKVVVGNEVKNIEFTKDDIQDKLDEAFGAGAVSLGADGLLSAANGKAVSVANYVVENESSAIIQRERVFSNNYIQLTLDAARALRNGDIEYANACIDRIVTANEHLLVEIADLGCNEDFIDFNLDRITTREYNLAERQNELETADPEYQITLWKQYEAYYNACLQMSSTVIPNSIFNYMK